MCDVLSDEKEGHEMDEMSSGVPLTVDQVLAAVNAFNECVCPHQLCTADHGAIDVLTAWLNARGVMTAVQDANAVRLAEVAGRHAREQEVTR